LGAAGGPLEFSHSFDVPRHASKCSSSPHLTNALALSCSNHPRVLLISQKPASDALLCDVSVGSRRLDPLRATSDLPRSANIARPARLVGLVPIASLQPLRRFPVFPDSETCAPGPCRPPCSEWFVHPGRRQFAQAAISLEPSPISTPGGVCSLLIAIAQPILKFVSKEFVKSIEFPGTVPKLQNWFS
jgi:hypothetical protein